MDVPMVTPSWMRRAALLAAALGTTLLLGACTRTSAAPAGRIVAVGAENEYADVISQIGGRYVAAEAVMSNPNTDPHTFEASPQVAEEVASAQLVVQNGLGYDTFMGQVEQAQPSNSRKVIDVQALLGLPGTTANPHLWYDPTTMPAVAKAIGDDLAAIDPSHRSYFLANVAAFDHSLLPLQAAIAKLRSAGAGVEVATTEPVADYLITAVGLVNATPFPFQADVMNGVDPSPQDVATEQSLFTDHEVKVFVYNQQVTDALTGSLLSLAAQQHIPVVGVYETMPTPGYDYQTWMLAEVDALTRAIEDGTSARRL
jgi:zinc/manganese transport system substrate-binding protein